MYDERYIDNLKDELKKLEAEVKKLKNKIECPSCNGSKSMPFSLNGGRLPCKVCKGTGKKYRS